MKHQALSVNERAQVFFTDLVVLGINRVTGFTSDFTTAGTSQTFTLPITLNPGDVVDSQAVVDVRVALAGTGITAATGTLAVSGSPAGSTVSLTDATSTVLGNYNATGGESITFTVSTIGGNVSAITAGEVYIWLLIRKAADRLRITV